MPFRFKEFNIIDDNTPMKVGVDAVLLGSWINAKHCNKILDVGSGSGIIALMLAQKYKHAIITAIEINNKAYIDLQENIANSKWSNRIIAINDDFNSFRYDNKFHLIVSNPPFFDVVNNKMKIGRKLARQSISLSISQMCETASGILNNNSSFVVIFPYSKRFEFLREAFMNGFYILEELRIRDNSSSVYKRSILHFKNSKVGVFTQNSLELKSDNGGYSEMFIKLTKDFYL